MTTTTMTVSPPVLFAPSVRRFFCCEHFFAFQLDSPSMVHLFTKSFYAFEQFNGSWNIYQLSYGHIEVVVAVAVAVATAPKRQRVATNTSRSIQT